MRRTVLTLMLLAAAVTGCTRPETEARFLLTDAKISAAYVTLAHPGAIAQARADGDYMRAAGLNVLARQIYANSRHKVLMVESDTREAEMALEAIVTLDAILEGGEPQ